MERFTKGQSVPDDGFPQSVSFIIEFSVCQIDNAPLFYVLALGVFLLVDHDVTFINSNLPKAFRSAYYLADWL
jgi:hypothetical protein